MPHGKAARKRNWQQASKAKVAARKAQKRAAKAATMDPQPRPLVIPTVTEDDLLSFQFAHFGDDTKPDTFFVDPQQALKYQPGLEHLGDDGLGWYEDGVKRALTDEQIEMFRHTELEELKRLRKLEAEAREDFSEDDEDDEYEPTIPDAPLAPAPAPQSPVSDASSLEDELSTKPTTSTLRQQQPKKSCGSTDHSQTPNKRQRTRSPRRKPRKKEIPYDQRNKRKWENYIDGEDPIHGSMTHRRLVRELDEQRGRNITIDYGDDESVVAPPTRSTAGPARKIISYEDD